MIGPMISKTTMLALVKELRSQEVRNALAENPGLLAVRDKRGRNWLHLCCGVDVSKRPTAARDSMKLAEVLLENGLGINDAAFTEGRFRATPLWYAIAFGKNLDLARYLLKRGSDPNHCLFAAAYNDDSAAIKLLVKNGAEMNPEAEDATPFLFAVQWSRFEAAQELLKFGADPNYQDSKGMTALHYMLKKGTDKKHFRMALDYGARADIKNKDGVTAAEIMARKKDPEYRRMAALLVRVR
jgi:ankyrin repeat protein